MKLLYNKILFNYLFIYIKKFIYNTPSYNMWHIINHVWI